MPKGPPLDALAFLDDDDGHPPCGDAACGVCWLLEPLTPELAARMRVVFEAAGAGLAHHPRRPERRIA
jgi:hypothetical protein